MSKSVGFGQIETRDPQDGPSLLCSCMGNLDRTSQDLTKLSKKYPIDTASLGLSENRVAQNFMVHHFILLKVPFLGTPYFQTHLL